MTKKQWIEKIADMLQPNVFTRESPLWVSTFKWLEKAPAKHLQNLAMLIDCRREE